MPETISNIVDDEQVKKMTQKEIYELIAENCADIDEIVEFCERKIAQLNKPKVRKANPDVVAFRDSVLVTLGEIGHPVTNKELAEELDVSSQKVSSALRYLIKEGAVMRFEEDKTVFFACA